MENEGLLFDYQVCPQGQSITSPQLTITRRGRGVLAYVSELAGTLLIQTPVANGWATIDTIAVVAGQADAVELPAGMWALRIWFTEGGVGDSQVSAQVRFS